MKHCIVTPDLSGPAKNGGIGTHVYHIAAYLSKERGEDVEILLTIPTTKKDSTRWKQFFMDSFGVKLTYLAELPGDFDRRVDCGQSFHLESIKIDRYLRTGDYQFIHFQDWIGQGFVSMQAKGAGIAYHNTVLTVTMHSSTEWFGEGGKYFFPEGLDNMLIQFCERYCAEHADLIISPSQYMLRWAEQHDWKLAPNRQVVPYLVQPAKPDSGGNLNANWKPKELIFFGRLETRKGLGVFLKALTLLKNTGDLKEVERITFMGRVWQLQGVFADKAIKDYFEENLPDVKYELVTNLDHTAAMAYLDANRSDALVLLPSLTDNFPYTVLECLQLSVHFVASRIGGIPEMMEDDCLFDPKPDSLAEIIRKALRLSLPLPKSLYDLEHAKSRTYEVLKNNEPPLKDAAHLPGKSSNANGAALQQPDTTICITYYNYGDVLPDLLKSLENQTDSNFTVIVVNDGSTDSKSKEVFDASGKKYEHLGWKFVEKANGGLAVARNHAASLAKTPYIIFMDADNIADPRMVEIYRAAMHRGKADCLTCYMSAFENNSHPDQGEVLYYYAPYGGCLEAAPVFNILGDANCILKAEVFARLGGFSVERHASFEDYEFFTKLVLEGFKMDVVPEFLFHYRVTPGGFSRITNDYDNQMRAIRPILDKMEPWQRRLVMNTIGLHMAHHQLQMTHQKCRRGGRQRRNRGPVSQLMRNVEEGIRKKLLKPLKEKLFKTDEE